MAATNNNKKTSRTRPSNYKVKPICKHSKDILTLNLNRIVRELEAVKTKNGGKIPYGSITATVQKMQHVLPWLTKNMIQNQLRKRQNTPQLDDCGEITYDTAILTLRSAEHTADDKIEDRPQNDDGSHHEEEPIQTTVMPVQQESESEGRHQGELSQLLVDETSTNQGSLEPAASDDVEAAETAGRAIVTLFGRPKGTTMATFRDLKARVQLATAEAAAEYILVRENAKMRNQRAERGLLTRIIAAAKQKHGVETETISKYTVRSRVTRKKVNPAVRQGTPSPMLTVEPCIVDLIAQLSRMRSPINVTAGLQLANSIVAGTSFESEIREWKQKHNVQYRMKSDDPGGGPLLLGWGYWNGFMKRNGHQIKSKKAVKFESKRVDWCTYHNFSTMYQEVYEEMVKGGIATKNTDEAILNTDGEPTTTDSNTATGLPTRYTMCRPDKLVFVDEVGSNTSTTKDGNVGGEKFLCAAESRPQVRAATKDSHFTVLGFTTATGVPLMCAIIFASKKLHESWVFGFDASATWVGDDKDLQGNAGMGKPLPMGPTCNVNGIEVPTFCCSSESGSITGDLLVAMLTSIDKLGVFDRSDGVAPFLLLDGHGSRFDLKFLRYINTNTTKWNACIGVPYGTSYWQVGDSTEQNGCFKMALTKHKRNLLRRKEECRSEFAIEKIDIVYLVHQAWLQSFARVESNKKAIADRGWNPLTYNCLLHPEILATKYQHNTTGASNIEQSATSPTSLAITEKLNLSQGLAGSYIDAIVETRMRDDACNGVNLDEIRRKQKQSAIDAMETGKRITAGRLVASGSHALGPDLFKKIADREMVRDEEECEKVRKKIREFRTLQDKVSGIQALNKQHDQMTVSELRTMVLWYKRPTDSSAPTNRQLLLTRLRDTCVRDEPKEPIPFFARTP
ncbi:hypothetical protein MHU86_8182 [Fragilaria crotonensis]|nr:hypothetical protein MHU86_8182 [Fragilaria crotonensis]